jgi:hypothetical protein
MNKSNIIRAITLAMGMGAVLALTVSASASPRMTAASASGRGGVTIHPHVIGPAAIGLTTATPTSNRTFAGYQATVPAGSATVETASFTVPTLSCTTTDRAIAADVGVLVNNFKTVSIAGVITACASGAAVYDPWVVVNGKETVYTASPVAAGDVIDLTTKVSTNRTRVQVTDVTTSVTQKIIGAGASASAAYIGDDALSTSSGTLFHVPDFGKLTFKNCVIDGKALASWRPHAFQRVNSLGTVQIATGGLFPGGTAFSTHFEHS